MFGMKNKSTKKVEYEQTIAEIDAELLDLHNDSRERVFYLAKTLCSIAANRKGYTKPYTCAVRENGNCANGFIDDYLNYCALKLVGRRELDVTGQYPTKRFCGKVSSWLAYANSMVRWWLIEYNTSVIDYNVLQLAENIDSEDENNNFEWVDERASDPFLISEMLCGITAKNIINTLKKMPSDFDKYHYDILYYLVTQKFLDCSKSNFAIIGGKYLIRSLIYDRE